MAVRLRNLNGRRQSIEFFSKSLAGMIVDVEILPLNIVKRIHVLFGRITALPHPARSNPTNSPPLAKSHTASSAISSGHVSLLRITQND